jgi:hypothetical protein
MLNKHFFILLFLSVFSCSLVGMTYDSRHFPLLDKPIFRHDDVNFFVRAQPFVFFSDSSWGDEEDDDSIGLFELGGRLNQNDWDDVLLQSGTIRRKLVPPNFSFPTLAIPWDMRGKFDAGGMAFRWYYTLSKHLEFGGSFFVMGARSRLEALLQSTAFIVDQTKSDNDASKLLGITKGDIRDLQTAFDEQRKAAKLENFLWSQAGISDLDLYLRLAYRRHYFLRCKTFDASMKLGFIAPTSKKRDLDNPASLPFGGNGFWGTYVDFAIDNELKDDIFAGFNIRFIQRIGRSEKIRLPVRRPVTSPVPKRAVPAKENEEVLEAIPEFAVPLAFNPIVGDVHISPGFTFVFSPYAAITNYRDGVGAQISYTLIMHTHDSFKDLRTHKDVTVDFDALRRRSSWASEYISFGLSYDFAKDRECRGMLPTVFLDIDYPVHFFVAKRSNKTFGVSLRVETDL